MSDYIERKDAEKWLTNLREDCGRYQDLWHYAEALDQIIELLSVDVTPKWIPCGERLPSEEGAYIVYAPTYRGGSSTAKENHGGIMFSKWKNSKWSIEHGYYERPNCVLAWMPLPEPYKGERKDDEIDRR